MLSPIGVRYDPEWEKLNNKGKQQLLRERMEKRAREEGTDSRGPPPWFRAVASWGWEKKISPFSFARFAGKK